MYCKIEFGFEFKPQRINKANMKHPFAAQDIQFLPSGSGSQVTPLAPHQAAAMQHSFGINPSRPSNHSVDLAAVQQWRETGNITGTEINTNFGMAGIPRLEAGGLWKGAGGGYPISGRSSGLSRESSRDDLTSMGDSMSGQIFDYEERFRVDRRKLELLMIGRFDPIKVCRGEV